jgi:hypothetical protein
MFTCVFCHWDIDLDDVELNHGDGKVVCTACFRRETGDTTRMSKALRAELVLVCKNA